MTTMAQRARLWITARHLAQLGILAQMLAGFRTVGEYFRLEWAGAATTAVVGPLLLGAMIAIGGACLSVILYFFGRNRLVIALTVAVIAALVAYRFAAMSGLG
jgi:hypothetical protein